MFGAALFAIGVVAGITARIVLRRARLLPPDKVVARESRPRSMTPVSALLGEHTREEPLTDMRFALLPRESLEDLRVHYGAAAVAVWRATESGLVPDFVVGNEALVDLMEPRLQPLLAWSAQEGVAQLGPDGDVPVAGVAPLGAAGQRAPGALAILFAEPFAGDRAQLKRQLLRHGERVGVITELVRTHDELAKMNKRTRELLRETQNWDVEERPGDLGVRLCAMIERLTGADGAALVRWDEHEQIGAVVVADGSCAQFTGSTVDDDSLAGTACRENVPQLWHEVSGRGEGPEALFSRSLPTQTGCVLVQPLRRRGAVVGAAVAAHRAPGALGPAELRALSLFDAVASFRLASAWKLEEVTKRASVDGLTGLTNRRGFESEMRVALEEQMRFGWNVSLVLVDVDHFKLVNDTHGHEVGDTVLRAIAATLDEVVRATDVCARVGGEEMALVLKDTDTEGALELAERLRASIEAMRVPFGAAEIQVTASFGVATYPAEVADWDALYRTADRALYDAKQAGRNQVRGVPGAVRNQDRRAPKG